jgi:hypothetical protein
MKWKAGNFLQIKFPAPKITLDIVPSMFHLTSHALPNGVRFATVNLDGMATGFVEWVNVARTAFLFEHPRPLNRAGPWSWAHCGRTTTLIVVLRDKRLPGVIEGDNASSRITDGNRRAGMLLQTNPFRVWGDPTHYFATLNTVALTLRVSSRVPNLQGLLQNKTNNTGPTKPQLHPTAPV